MMMWTQVLVASSVTAATVGLSAFVGVGIFRYASRSRLRAWLRIVLREHHRRVVDANGRAARAEADRDAARKQASQADADRIAADQRTAQAEAAADAAEKRASQADADRIAADQRTAQAEAAADAANKQTKETETDLYNLKARYKELRKELFSTSDVNIENAAWRKEWRRQVRSLSLLLRTALLRLSAARNEIAKKEANEEIREILDILEGLVRGK